MESVKTTANAGTILAPITPRLRNGSSAATHPAKESASSAAEATSRYRPSGTTGERRMFITCFTVLIDPAVGKRAWKEAVLFPGAVNVIILAAAILPGPLSWLAHQLAATAGIALTPGWAHGVELFIYIWLTACMGVAYLGKVCESRPLGRITGPALMYIGGYGPLLCAISTAAYVRDLQRAEVHWDKTEKTGRVVAPA